MNILDVNFKKVSKLELIHKLRKGEFKKTSKNEQKELINKFDAAMGAGDYLTAQNTSIAAIFFHSDEFFVIIRRRGIFRYSKYINKKCIVKNIATELINICETFNCYTTAIESYLHSIINYSSVIYSYAAFDRFILSEIKAFEQKFPNKSLIKTLLSTIDYHCCPTKIMKG